jgi:hypothetical protein
MKSVDTRPQRKQGSLRLTYELFTGVPRSRFLKLHVSGSYSCTSLPSKPDAQAREVPRFSLAGASGFDFRRKPVCRTANATSMLLFLAFATLAAAQSPSRLPWEEPERSTAQPATSALELLHLFGIDDTQLDQFRDGHPLDTAEHAILLRILFRLPRFPLSDLRTWARTSWQPRELARDPSSHRGMAFLVTGRARQVERVPVPKNSAIRLEFEEYYRVELARPDGASRAVILTRSVPAAWLEAELDEPASVFGLFIKSESDNQQLVFAAPRCQWYPERAAGHPATAGQVLLAGLGMDIGLFDDVRGRNREPIEAADRECFYQLLATVGNAPMSNFTDQDGDPIELGPLLQQPNLHHGDRMTVRGTVRRITKVVVTDQDIRQRLGIDGYYQLDMFVPLEDQVIQFTSDDPSTQPPTFANSYPVTLCTLRLPAELTEGEDLRHELRVPAVFFKLWAYRSRYVSSFDEGQLQLSPMLIGKEPIVVSQQPSTPTHIAILMGCGFLVLLATIWFALWRIGQGDRAFAKARRMRK